MAAREHSRSGRVHPDATVMTSRRALLGAALAIPLACAASPRRREFTALSPPDAHPPGPLPLPDAHPPNAARSFAVTKSDRAPSLPDCPEPGRRSQDDDSADAQHAESHEAQSPAVTKWDRALARFRRAERIVKAAEGEPDEDRAVYPERPRRGLSKGHSAQPLQRHAESILSACLQAVEGPAPPHSRPSSRGVGRQARRREPPRRLGAHRRRNLHRRARPRCAEAGGLGRLVRAETQRRGGCSGDARRTQSTPQSLQSRP
jgi:hypothetical protein